MRDLLRRRLLLVRQATAHKLSFKSLYARTSGQTLSLSRLERLTAADVPGLFASRAEQLIAQEQLRLISELGRSIHQLERSVVGAVKDWASYRWVQSQRLCNGKVKGTNNAKNGNRYLAWAWVEAAPYARRYYGP